MVRYTYTTSPPPRPLYNPDLLESAKSLTKAENTWVHRALKERRKNIYAQLIKVRFYRYLVMAITLAFPSISFVSGSELIIVVSVLITAVILALYVKLGLPVNRDAVQTALTHLQTDTNQIPVLVTGKASLSLVAGETIHCMMSPPEGSGEDVPLHIPGHWAHMISTIGFAQVPIRLAKVEAQGTIAAFETMMKRSARPDGGITKHPTKWTYLSDSDYILLAIGDLSIDAEIEAGLPQANISTPQTDFALFLLLSGMLIAALSGPLDDLLPLAGSETWVSPWFLGGFTMVTAPFCYIVVHLRRYKAIRRFYQTRNISFQ